MGAIAITDPHPTEEDLLEWKFQESTDDLIHAYPGHLRIGVQAIAIVYAAVWRAFLCTFFRHFI